MAVGWRSHRVSSEPPPDFPASVEVVIEIPRGSRNKYEFDEATGAIDVESEAAILSRLKALQPRPTILLIAHRAESLAYCDWVIRLSGETAAP